MYMDPGLAETIRQDPKVRRRSLNADQALGNRKYIRLNFAKPRWGNITIIIGCCAFWGEIIINVAKTL